MSDEKSAEKPEVAAAPKSPTEPKAKGGAKTPKPATMPEYEKWALEQLKVDYKDQAIKNLFGINTLAIRSALEASNFYRELPQLLKTSQIDYKGLHGVPLLMTEETPIFQLKEYDKAVNKSWRSNALENWKWPSEPKWGWTNSDNWFSKINDLVRTTIVCKYMDGPKFLAERLAKLAKDNGLTPDIKTQERDSGYYAVHFYLDLPVDLVDKSLKTVSVTATCEIQITTQLQEVLRLLSHTFYEQTRVAIDDDDAWKWDHTSPRFRSSFMGHTLHLLEGVIVELRDGIRKADERDQGLSGAEAGGTAPQDPAPPDC